MNGIFEFGTTVITSCVIAVNIKVGRSLTVTSGQVSSMLLCCRELIRRFSCTILLFLVTSHQRTWRRLWWFSLLYQRSTARLHCTHAHVSTCFQLMLETYLWNGLVIAGYIITFLGVPVVVFLYSEVLWWVTRFRWLAQCLVAFLPAYSFRYLTWTAIVSVNMCVDVDNRDLIVVHNIL